MFSPVTCFITITRDRTSPPRWTSETTEVLFVHPLPSRLLQGQVALPWLAAAARP